MHQQIASLRDCAALELDSMAILSCRYTDQEFDAAFIDVLREFCHKHIQEEEEVTLANMVEALRLQVQHTSLHAAQSCTAPSLLQHAICTKDCS